MSSELVKIIEDLRQKAINLPPEDLPALLSGLGGIVIILASRSSQENFVKAESRQDSDRLLNAKEAAAKLGCSTDRLYRHPKEFRSFEVHFGRTVRWSERGIERFIARRRRENLN